MELHFNGLFVISNEIALYLLICQYSLEWSRGLTVGLIYRAISRLRLIWSLDIQVRFKNKLQIDYN